jgi:predicted permease
MNTILQDFRFAVRLLRRSPGFTLVAVLTLALGIGINTAIFSVVNGVLLRPLPYADPDALVRLHHVHHEQAPTGGAFSPQDVEDLQAGAAGFAGIAAYGYLPGQSGLDLTGEGSDPRRVEGVFVSPEFFPLLGVGAAHGRTLHADESRPGGDRAVVLSDALWRSRFDADPGVVGRTLTLDGEPYSVVGIMPPHFAFPAPAAEVWVPLSRLGEDAIPRQRGIRWLQVVARVAPGVRPETALGSANATLAALAAEHPATNEGWTGARMEPLRESIVGTVRPALLLLLGTVLLVLVVACANLANLLLARATAREREMAVRAAVGAGRGRLVRQMLTESLLLSFMGGIGGVLLAAAGVRVLLAASAGSLPRADEVGLDGGVILFAVGVSLLTALLFGLVPALRAAGGAPAAALRDAGRGGSERGGVRTREVLVLAQTAVAMVLLVAAGLLTNSFWRLINVDPGFRPDDVLVASFTIPADRYETPERMAAYRDEVLRRVREVPGVVAAGAAKTQPLLGGGEPIEFVLPGRSGPEAVLNPPGGAFVVSPGYFEALRIPLQRGRVFEPHDDVPGGALAMVVSQAAAQRYWPGSDAVGETVRIGEESVQVVGVVGDVRNNGLGATAEPAVYVPFAMAPRVATQLFVRGTLEPGAAAAAVRQAIHAADPLQPIAQIRPMRSAMAETVAQPRFFAALLALFSALALFLASLGLYGVVAFTVNRRATEIGIRMALGAETRDVVGMMVWRTMIPIVGGVVVGAVGAWMLSRLMGSMLYEVGAGDPATFAVTAALLTAVALLAAWIPARRAARIEPATALRTE